MCDICKGNGGTFERVPQKSHGTVYVHPETGYPCWPCDGGVPQRVEYLNGRMTTVWQECPACAAKPANATEKAA